MCDSSPLECKEQVQVGKGKGKAYTPANATLSQNRTNYVLIIILTKYKVRFTKAKLRYIILCK